MMKNVSITKAWFEEIKNRVKHANAYEVTDGAYKGKIEVDVDIEEFNKVSEELGWM